MDNKIYQGKSGTSYMVTETPLASGGEGSIYAINGEETSVLKVFKQDRRTKEREEKLLKMVEYRLDTEQLNQVTWPQDVVYDQSGFVGYVMPRLWDNQNLNKVYATQNNALSLRHRMLIAYNLCAAIDTVHSLNQVCGDLNPQNICVNLNLQSNSALRITLVDTDSYHITDGDKTYRCEVGLANYLAPEIQNKLINGRNLRNAPLPTFTKETDLFALAVHIFSLVMNGCHPFACAKQTNNGYENTMEAMNDKDYESVVLPQPIDNIKEGFFPFHQEKEGITYPLYAPDFKLLPKELQELFIRAFEMGYQNPKERPTTTEWLEVLKKYLSSTEFQQCERKHYYYNNNENKCPYCEASQRMMRVMSGQGSPNKGNVNADFVYHQKSVGSNQNTQNAQTSNQTKSSFNTQMQKKGKVFHIIAAIVVAVITIGSIVLYNYEVKVEQEKKNVEYSTYLAVADSAKESNNYAGAIQQYKNAIDVGLDEGNAYIGLAECYVMQDDLGEAFNTINICKDKCNVSDDVFADIYQLSADKYYELARNYVKKEQYDEAKTILNEGIKNLQASGDYEKLEDYLQVVQDIEQVITYLDEDLFSLAFEEFSYNLADRKEEEISDVYNNIFYEVKEHIEKIIKKINKKKYKGAYNLLKEYGTKFGYMELWYYDGKIYDTGNNLSGKCLYINTYSDAMYYGDVQAGKFCGKGIQIGQYYNEGVYYDVSGEFKNDLANGQCKYFVSQKEYSDGTKYKMTLTGNFTNGYEDGVMKEKRVNLDDGTEYNFQHTAKMGTYSVIREENGEYVYQDNGYWYSAYDSKEGLKDHRVPSISW